MQAYSNYTINFYSAQEDIEKVLPIIKEVLGYKTFDFPDVIEIEEERSLVWVEEITENLAVKMAKKAPSIIFSVDGTVTTESSGECMEFSIAYADGLICEVSSDWHDDTIMTDVPLDNVRQIKI